MIGLLYCLQLLCCECNYITLTIDVPSKVIHNEVVMITGTLSNEYERSISFWDFELFESLYRGDIHWNITIFKEEEQYYIPMVFFHKKEIKPKVIKIKKNEKYRFQIPIIFNELTKDGFLPISNIENGYYEIQLSIVLKEPKGIIITSNKAKFHLINDNK